MSETLRLKKYTNVVQVIDSMPEQSKMMKRAQALEGPFEVGVVGLVKMFKGQEFTTLEALWDQQQLDVFIPINSSVLKPTEQTRIITGACLFGGNWGLQAETENRNVISLTSQKNLGEAILDDDPVVKILDAPEIHPAEFENVLRLTEGLSFFAKTHNGPSLTVSFHIPDLEYMLYALDLVKEQAMSLDVFSRACDVIQVRAEKMKKIYSKRVPGNVDLDYITPLKAIEKLIMSVEIEKITPLSFLACIDNEAFLTIREGGWLPESFSDIAFMSYAVAYWQHFLSAKREGANSLAMETVEEIKIFAHAKKLSSLFDEKLGILPIYLPPKVVAQGGKDLFWMEKPETLLPILRFIEEACHENY